MRAILLVIILSLVARVAVAQDATAEEVRAALAAQPGEPDVHEVVAAVLRHSGIDPSRADGAMERARLSGLLPMVRAGFREGTGYDFLTRQTDITGTSSLTGIQQLAFIGQVTFRLDRLLYAGDERALLRESRTAAQQRLEIISETVRLYFERRRLLAEIALTGQTDLDREARIAEIDALFQVMSGGEIVMPTHPIRPPEEPE